MAGRIGGAVLPKSGIVVHEARRCKHNAGQNLRRIFVVQKARFTVDNFAQASARVSNGKRSVNLRDKIFKPAGFKNTGKNDKVGHGDAQTRRTAVVPAKIQVFAGEIVRQTFVFAFQFAAALPRYDKTRVAVFPQHNARGLCQNIRSLLVNDTAVIRKENGFAIIRHIEETVAF